MYGMARPTSVSPRPMARKGEEVGQDQDNRRQEELEEHEVEDKLPPGEPDAGQRIAGQGDGHELDGEEPHRVEDGVAVVEDERRRLPGLLEALERRGSSSSGPGRTPATA